MRVPSLHIDAEYLNALIEKWFKDHKIGNDPDDLVEYLLLNGVRHTLTHRKKLENYKNGTKSKAFQLKSSSIEAARLFAGLLKKIREQKKHRGVSRIREGSTEWGILKEVTGKATTFCESYNYSLRDGFIRYITIYINLTSTTGAGRQSTQRFDIRGISAKHDLICSIYEAESELELDEDKAGTRTAHDVYSGLVSEKTGIAINYTKEPLKYIYFMYASIIAKQFGISSATYIKAQFKALDWTNGIPIPSQLITKNAEERTVKFMSENGITKKDDKDPNQMSEKQMKDFWDRVKRGSHEDTD